MHAKNGAPATSKSDAQVADDMYPFLRRYKDGRVERLVVGTFVPPSSSPDATGVATRDVVIDPRTGVSVRLFLSVGTAAMGSRLPLAVYFHGGAFCTGSAFSGIFQRYAATLSAHAEALVVSVDYRLAPEHPIPAAYDDAWMAFRWVVSLSDPWLACHADPMRVFLVGESAGANIVHNVALRSASRHGQDLNNIQGIVLLQPFFWGTERLPSETNRVDGPVFSPEFVDTVWPFLTAGAAGNDDPRLNPPAEQVMSLRCRRALVTVAAKDVLRDRGCRYATWLRCSEWCREVTLVESESEDHGFHLYRPARASAVALMDCVAEFINDGILASPIAETELHQERPNVQLRARDGIQREQGQARFTKPAQKGPISCAAGTMAKSCL
ncbi:hypothetical protein ACP70R_004344 [Stipagrostis hirtigluma subsp. patula]